MVAVYVRVSDSAQEDNYSTDTQKALGKAFANKLGEKYELYEETISGRELTRPEFQRMVNDISESKINKIWVVELQRLSRGNEDDELAIRKMLTAYNVDLYINNERVDLKSADGMFKFRIQSAVSRYESDKTKERVIRTRREQIDQGYQAFSSLYGYYYRYNNDGEKVWHEQRSEAATVRKVYALYAKGLSYVRIVNSLNDAGIKTKKGKRFTITTIAKMLSHPEYFGQTKNTKGESIQSKVYSPILSDAEYKSLQAEHKNRKRRYMRFRHAKTELAGMITCKNCGARYYVHRSKHKSRKTGRTYWYIRFAHKNETTENQLCKNKPKYMPKDMLELLVQKLYGYLLTDETDLQEFIKKTSSELLTEEKEVVAQVKKLSVEIRQIDRNRKELIDGIAEHLYTREEVRENLTRMNVRKAEAETTIIKLRESLQLKSGQYARFLMEYSADKFLEFDHSTAEERRKLYETAIEHFHVDMGYLELKFITGRVWRWKLGEQPEGS